MTASRSILFPATELVWVTVNPESVSHGSTADGRFVTVVSSVRTSSPLWPQQTETSTSCHCSTTHQPRGALPIRGRQAHQPQGYSNDLI